MHRQSVIPSLLAVAFAATSTISAAYASPATTQPAPQIPHEIALAQPRQAALSQRDTALTLILQPPASTPLGPRQRLRARSTSLPTQTHG
jgi:hypothetical protein